MTWPPHHAWSHRYRLGCGDRRLDSVSWWQHTIPLRDCLLPVGRNLSGLASPPRSTWSGASPLFDFLTAPQPRSVFADRTRKRPVLNELPSSAGLSPSEQLGDLLAGEELVGWVARHGHIMAVAQHSGSYEPWGELRPQPHWCLSATVQMNDRRRHVRVALLPRQHERGRRADAVSDLGRRHQIIGVNPASHHRDLPLIAET